MKKTNQLFATIVVLLLFFATTLRAQEKKEVKYITVTESYWNMDKEAFPENDENKAKVKTWNSYFTGVHGDYVYTIIHDLAK